MSHALFPLPLALLLLVLSGLPARGDEGPPRLGKARKQALGSDAARKDRATKRALDWLATHQDEDGRLDADGFDRHCPAGDPCGGKGGGHHGERTTCGFDGVTTALAVLAWSANGSTPTSGPYASNIERGLSILVPVLRRRTGGFDQIWNQVYAMQAVADVVLTTQDAGLRTLLETAVQRLEARQLPDGGWSYIYGIGDVPTTSAALVALGMAERAGLAVTPSGIDRALVFLDRRVETKTGRSEYHKGAEQKGYTPTTANAAADLAARAALGRLKSAPALSRQLAAVRKKKPRWKLEEKEVKTRDGRTVKAQVGNLYPYAWYLTTVALERKGGAAWKAWDKAVTKALLDGQEKDGHAAGSWDPLGPYSLSGGRIFVTALGALMLQAPCRFEN